MLSNDRFLTLAVICSTCMAAAIIGINRFGIGPAPLPDIPEEHQPRIVPNWRDYSADVNPPEYSHSLMPNVVIFSDYMCQYCAAVWRDLNRIHERSEVALNVTVRHFAVLGSLSQPAAIAAECSRAWDGFPEMHSLLLEKQDSLGFKSWSSFAREAGSPDLAAFETCMTGDGAPARVELDRVVGHALGVVSTPTLLVDSLLFVGNPGAHYLEAYARRHQSKEIPRNE